MKVLLVAGARPNFMKVASIIDAIRKYNRANRPPIQPVLVHTGQHYDEQMSGSFFRDLSLPEPDINLEVGSSSHAYQTAEIMKRFEPVVLKEHPDVVLVVGDVNSTVACALVAAKTAYSHDSAPDGPARPLIAHIEAGLRSFDRSMPEEINRILTDALSDFLFITEERAERNLLREGIPKEKIHFVGNTMVDTLLKHQQKARKSRILFRLGLEEERGGGTPVDYGVVTLHRPSNVDNSDGLRDILESLSEIGKRIPLFFPVHPRTLSQIRKFDSEGYFNFLTLDSNSKYSDSRVNCLEPLGYLDFLHLMSNARLALTDSGGIQEETTVLGVPCVTLRQNTERPVTLESGTNVLAGTEKQAIFVHAMAQLDRRIEPRRPKLWDGQAGQRIVKVLTEQSCPSTKRKVQRHGLDHPGMRS